MSEPEPGAKSPSEETEVDQVLAEFNGDYRQAIAALLHDLKVLAADARALVSRGYVRGIDFTEWTKRGRAG